MTALMDVSGHALKQALHQAIAQPFIQLYLDMLPFEPFAQIVRFEKTTVIGNGVDNSINSFSLAGDRLHNRRKPQRLVQLL